MRKYSWAYIFRVICENYPGITPADIRKMTMNDVLILTLERKQLLGNAEVKMSVEQARSKGFRVPENRSGKSLVKMIKEQEATKLRLDEEKKSFADAVRSAKKRWRKKHDSKPFVLPEALAEKLEQHSKEVEAMKRDWIKSI